MDIFPIRIRKALASVLRLIHAVAIGHLRHGLHIRRIQFVQRIDMTKDRIEITHHAGALVLSQFQIAEISYVGHVFFCDFHFFTVDRITGVRRAGELGSFQDIYPQAQESASAGLLGKFFSTDHKLYSDYALSDVAIDHGQILRGQSLQLSSPAGIWNFHAQNSLGKVQSSSPRCYSMSAGQRPSQHWPLSGRCTPQASAYNLFKSGANMFQCAPH